MNRRQAHGFELKVSHGSRGVLGQSLIDADAYLLAGFILALAQVAPQNLLDNVQWHRLSSISSASAPLAESFIRADRKNAAFPGQRQTDTLRFVAGIGKTRCWTW